MGICVNLISRECVCVALNTFIRVCGSVYTCTSVLVSWGPRGCVGFSVPVSVFLSEDPNHVSAPFFYPPSFIHSWPLPTPHLPFSPFHPPLYQVDPGPREGRPPGLVALSRDPQPPPPAPRHEPPLPKNQAGVEAAQGRGGQEEVRLGPQTACWHVTTVPVLLLDHNPSWGSAALLLVTSLISDFALGLVQLQLSIPVLTLLLAVLLARAPVLASWVLSAQEHPLGSSPSPRVRVIPS